MPGLHIKRMSIVANPQSGSTPVTHLTEIVLHGPAPPQVPRSAYDAMHRDMTMRDDPHFVATQPAKFIQRQKQSTSRKPASRKSS
jgi:hypothetical protein